MANLDILKNKCKNGNFEKLEDLSNPALMNFVAEYAELMEPDSIYVFTDSKEDWAYAKENSIQKGEEKTLKIEGHTVHFDGPKDQGRDKKNTKLLYPEGELPEGLNGLEREKGVKEVREIMKGIMKGKEMLVCFFALGPVDSPFYIPAVQITDSYYVAHSDNILYRTGYEGFKKAKPENFFKVVHSAGEVRDAVSVNIDKRRVYIDMKDELVYSCNTQYAGNTVGFKKLALRLAIQKASREGWLSEHMFVMGIKGPGGRVSYFSGAYPSMCGKTSTAMVEGESIVGDDIAYLRNIDGKVRAANVEQGIFGIIQDINPDSDPLIWEVLNKPGDVIFGNILVVDGVPYWRGDGRDTPEKGINFTGEWQKEKKDEEGNEIPHAHKNARYTIVLDKLDNCDKNLHNPDGVELAGIIYGGRDSDTWVPVRESFDWKHGVITMGASLESETTAATLGKEGERKFNVMSNMDFLSIPLSKYLRDYLEFGEKTNRRPSIFGCNYFLRDENGKFINAIKDKRVWLKWAELRANKDVEAIKTPTGYIPLYEDLKKLFKEVMGKDYTKEDYKKQFTVRVPENLAKIERILDIYKTKIHGAPEVLFDTLGEEKKRLEELKKEKGDYVEPDKL